MKYYCSTNTEYGVTIGFDYRVVGDAGKPFMSECISVKVSWIVMVATHEKKPVVGFIYSLGIALDNILIVPFSFKAQATISCHNDQSILLSFDRNHSCHSSISQGARIESLVAAPPISTYLSL